MKPKLKIDWALFADKRLTAEEADKNLRGMPGSHAEFREEALRVTAGVLRAMRECELMPSEFHGYRFDDAALADFDAAVADVLEVLRTGGTLFDKARHHAYIRTLKSAAAAAALH